MTKGDSYQSYEIHGAGVESIEAALGAIDMPEDRRDAAMAAVRAIVEANGVKHLVWYKVPQTPELAAYWEDCSKNMLWIEPGNVHVDPDVNFPFTATGMKGGTQPMFQLTSPSPSPSPSPSSPPTFDRASVLEALSTWDSAAAATKTAEADAMRLDFVERFPIDAWAELPLESYALGQQVEGGTVCWWLEFNTKPVASMSGGSSSKHLIFRRNDGSWRYPKEYSSVEEAWTAVRGAFVEAFDLASNGRFGEIAELKELHGASALRTKALYMYFPLEMVPVTSKTHIKHFLQALGKEVSVSATTDLNRQLLEALREIPELDGFNPQELGYFLYHWADPRAAVRVVKIAPGERASMWDDCLAGGFICMGWDEVPDLAQFESKEAFREVFRETYSYNGHEPQVTRKSNELWTLMDLQPGDKVIANRGISEILAIGTVNDQGYQWRPDRDSFKHTLGVDWDVTEQRTIEPINAWRTTTMSKVSAVQYQRIRGTATIAQPVEVDRVYRDVEDALSRRGQVILYGPPGTGKTYSARRAAVWLLEGGTSSLDACEILSDYERLRARESELSSRRNPNRKVWMMVANPANWSWDQLFVDETVDFTLGRIQRNFPKVRTGDLVVGYESSPTKRVVAVARVTAEYDPADSDDAALLLEPVSRVADGITYEELRQDPLLSESEPARNRCQGTLFALSTLEADRLLQLLADRDPAIAAIAEPSVQRLTRVTFHPSYTYEDFVEGFRPSPSGQGGLELALADGIFKQVCAAATADPSQKYLLLIDEINRGNIPKIFGELITLIEKDKRGLSVRLPQSGEEFSVPANLVIIATMNTADRSIHLLDTALRRRFAFIELMPDIEPLEGATVGDLALDEFLELLNDAVRQRVGREKQVGQALFFDDGQVIDTPEQFASIFRHELLPLLQEYLYEDYTALADVLGEVIDAKAERPASHVEDPEALCTVLADHFGAHAVT